MITVQLKIETTSNVPMQILPSIVACLKAKSRALAKQGESGRECIVSV
jgi:hypothetical protein